MQSTPQEVEQDVLVGPFQPPPPCLEVPSSGNGLLKDLIVLSHRPIPVIIIRDVGVIQQNRRHQRQRKELACIKKRADSFAT